MDYWACCGGAAVNANPVEVTSSNSGNVVDMPTQVTSIARAVEAYNHNDKDATEKSAMIFALVMSGLVALGGLIYKQLS